MASKDLKRCSTSFLINTNENFSKPHAHQNGSHEIDGANIPILQMKKLKLREIRYSSHGQGCPQSLPSFCSKAVVGLAPIDQGLPACLGNLLTTAGHSFGQPCAGHGESGPTHYSFLKSCVRRAVGACINSPWATRVLWGLENGGRRLGTDELGLPEQEELQEAAASQVCGWSGGRPCRSGGRALGLQSDLRGGTEGTGSCLPGLGHCARCGRACPKGNRCRPKSDARGHCWTQDGHSERCVCPVLDACPVNTWRSPTLLPCLHGGAKQACQESRG